MFRKDPKAREEWSPANVRLCAERQRRIIADIWPSLKPGGILVYSTCTFNTKENEENIVWIAETFGAEPLSPEFPSDWKITGSKRGNLPVFRFWPHLTKGEGFFIAALRKSPEDEISAYNKQKKNKTGNKQTINVIPNEVKNWLKDSSTCDFRLKGNQISAIPEIYKSIIQTLEENLKIISCGIPLAEVKGKDLIPQHTMAMCTAVNQNAFPVYEMEREAALQYLSRETISLPPDFPKGYILLTYNKHPLGFVKNIGNRTNNLYPQEWRIRMNVKDID